MTVSSEILQDGYAGNPTTLRNLQLLCGFALEEAAEFCCRPDADVRNNSVGVLRFARPRKKNEWYRKWSENYNNNCPQGVWPNLAGFRDPSAKKCAEDPY